MDTSSPSAFVNGALLSRYIGQKVRTVIQLTSCVDDTVFGKSTDDLPIVVTGPTPSHLTTFIEVVGIADNENTIRAENYVNFGDAFAPENFNELCELANGEFKDLFI